MVGEVQRLTDISGSAEGDYTHCAHLVLTNITVAVA